MRASRAAEGAKLQAVGKAQVRDTRATTQAAAAALMARAEGVLRTNCFAKKTDEIF